MRHIRWGGLSDLYLFVQDQQVICQGLGIADFMLEPVQRIPRYKLLLEGK